MSGERAAMEIEAGRWRARLTGAEGAAGALALRSLVFRGGPSDRDAFDAAARHLMIEDASGTVHACARLSVQDSAGIRAGYAAQFYDLTAFSSRFARALEVGRLCHRPGATDPDVPRLLLAVIARVVEAAGAEVLYGCSSFPAEAAALGRLADRIAPDGWRPGRKAAETVPLTGEGGTLPPLLRSYLSLGARVSDHGVVDRDLGTVHVFTGLPIAEIPPVRARLLTGMLATPVAAD